MWMNEMDLDNLVYNCRDMRRPVLRRAAHILSQLRDWTNANSDGWCYWQAPSRAASKMMTLAQGIQPDGWRSSTDDTDMTEADFKKALTPIKSFLTKHHVDHALVIGALATPSPKETS